MRSLFLGMLVALGLTAGPSTANAMPSEVVRTLPAPISMSVPAASHNCGKGQHWVPAGYAKHGKYRGGHCAPN
jgi:hypothetical protein